ncbi:RDD family protein [Mycolicibacterium celeriflavum]|uniref:RDD family protein n=1 Tax=Mycolicibacterium celeriflavum TaxID=1249101 RepID=A0A7I7RQ63_MYCCF|nr:RDD family protein [Mycolicibacterium celeriflavum]BBY46079.1 RDD family protein [Mycolicibacterium celeriflavum]
MTDAPLPPAGGSSPPPQGGASFVGDDPATVLPTEAYTEWFTRVVAWLVDYIPILCLLGIGWGVLLGTQETDCLTEVSGYGLSESCARGASTVGLLTIGVTSILVLTYVIWNYGHRQGTTGSSVGKSILRFKVVSEKTGEPIGFAMSIVRQLAHIIDAVICYIGFLFPLWDAKRQTIADKVIGTVCLPL